VSLHDQISRITELAGLCGGISCFGASSVCSQTVGFLEIVSQTFNTVSVKVLSTSNGVWSLCWAISVGFASCQRAWGFLTEARASYVHLSKVFQDCEPALYVVNERVAGAVWCGGGWSPTVAREHVRLARPSAVCRKIIIDQQS